MPFSSPQPLGSPHPSAAIMTMLLWRLKAKWAAPLWRQSQQHRGWYTAKGHNPYFPYAPSPSGGGLGGGSKVKIMPVCSIISPARKLLGLSGLPLLDKIHKVPYPVRKVAVFEYVKSIDRHAELSADLASIGLSIIKPVPTIRSLSSS